MSPAGSHASTPAAVPASPVTPRGMELLRHAADEAAELLKADGTIVYLLDRRDGFLHAVIDAGIASDEARAVIRRLQLPVGVGMFGAAVARREVVVTGNYHADTSFVHSHDADDVVRFTEMPSLAVAPLIVRERAIGALGAFSTQANRFGPAEVGLLRALANHAATAIELEARVTVQRTLSEIAAHITSTRDLETVLQRTVDAASGLLGADGARIGLVEDLAASLPGAFVDRDETPPRADDVVRPGRGISGKAIDEQRVVLTGDYLRDDSFTHSELADRDMRERGLLSVMAAPLVGDEGPIGTLAVHSRVKDAFGPDDAELLGALAGQAAIAITNARLYRELEETQARYRFLVDNSPDLIFRCDADGTFTFLSESVERLTGFRPEEAIGRHWTALTVPEHVPIVEESWRQMRAHPTREQSLRIEIPRKDESRVLVEIHAMPTAVDGRFAGAHGSVRDIGERERLERDLRRQAAELASSSERAHLARELHDSVTQALFSMTLETRSIELLLERNPDAVRNRLAALRDLQRDALAEMRSLIFELRPSSLEQDGLVHALRGHAAAVQGRIGLPVVVEADLEERLPIELEEALFRVAQEALHNTVKHAAARQVWLRVERDGPGVCMRVTDDGRGFDAATSAGAGHVGLAGMRARVERAGGSLTVHSAPGAGTTIEARVPIAGAVEPARPDVAA